MFRCETILQRQFRSQYCLRIIVSQKELPLLVQTHCNPTGRVRDMGGCSLTSNWNNFNKRLDVEDTWGRALFYRKITPYKSIPHRLLLIAVSISVSCCRWRLKCSNSFVIWTVTINFLPDVSQPTSTFRWYCLHMKRSEPSIVAKAAFCISNANEVSTVSLSFCYFNSLGNK